MLAAAWTPWRGPSAGRSPLLIDSPVKAGAGLTVSVPDVALWAAAAGSFTLAGALLVKGTGRTRHRRVAETNRVRQLAHLMQTFGRSQAMLREVGGRIVAWDEGNERLYGFSSAEAIGTVSHALLQTRFPKKLAEIDADLLRDGWWTGELVHRRKDGTLLTVISHWAMSGNGSTVIEVNSDITALKQAEAAVRDSEFRLQVALTAGGMGTWEIHPDGTMTWNGRRQSTKDGTGMARRVPIEDAFARIHPDDRSAVRDALRGAFATGGIFDQKFRVMKPGRPVKWLHSYGQAIASGDAGEMRMVGLNHDVTRQQEAEERLRESQTRFRVITDAMPQLVWSAQPDGTIDYFNQRWYELTGATYPASEGWAPCLHPEEKEHVLQRWRHALRTGEAYEVEHRIRRVDGEYRWKLSRALPVRDEAGAITLWLGTSTDIDAKVAARELLARSREDLEALVAERTQDLRETQEKLAHAERVRALGQLAGGIAHDFNNVLQAVQGAASLILQRPTDTEAVRRRIRLMLDAAERGSSITQRLLVFSRRDGLHSELVDVGELLGGMGELLRHTLGAGITVQVSAQPCLPPVLVDRNQLETVLVNLATNARDAMEGTGTLILAATLDVMPGNVAPGRQTDRPADLKPGMYVRLAATDTGVGMDPETLARVAEPFFTTKPHGKGTGLGLAMASGFAEQCGGGLRIYSRVGQGTVVTLWLPVAEATMRTDKREPDGGAGPARRNIPRLLLVDDDPIVREILEEQLKAAGNIVHTASDGHEALALLDEGVAAELLVADLSMPRMDGLALIRQARQRRPEMPAILLTGFATNAAETATGESGDGRIALLRKPVTGSDLALRVAAMLNDADATA